MNRLFRYVLVVALLTSVPLAQVSAQVRYSSQFSNTGAPAHFNRARFSYASPQNLFTVYKRGVSPFGNDREVKIACSVDSGRTWTEHDISYLGAASTDMPLVAATSTGVLCAHHFQDSTGQSGVRFCWSDDNGNSFQCRTELERNRVQDFWHDSSLLSDGASTFWYMNDLGTDSIWTSSDHGMTFESIRNPRRVDDTDGKSLLKFENGALWYACRTGEGQDSIVVYRSTDSGTTWLLVSSFRVSPGGKMSFDMDGDNVGVIWSESSYQGNLKYRYVTPSEIGPVHDIGRSASISLESLEVFVSGRNVWAVAHAGSYSGSIGYQSTDGGQTWLSDINLTGLMQQYGIQRFYLMNDSTFYVVEQSGMGMPNGTFYNLRWPDQP